jgi:hypothetical protein
MARTRRYTDGTTQTKRLSGEPGAKKCDCGDYNDGSIFVVVDGKLQSADPAVKPHDPVVPGVLCRQPQQALLSGRPVCVPATPTAVAQPSTK